MATHREWEIEHLKGASEQGESLPKIGMSPLGSDGQRDNLLSGNLSQIMANKAQGCIRIQSRGTNKST